MKVDVRRTSIGAYRKAHLERLEPDERARAGRFIHDDDRARFTLGRLLLRDALASTVPGFGHDVRLAYDRYGKPLVTAEGWSCSVSHSGTRVYVAVAPCARVGIDVERVDPSFDGADGIARFFNERERAQLASCASRDESTAAFYRCWVRKEAVLKALGLGIPGGLARFAVSLRPSQPVIEWAEDGFLDPSAWQMLDMDDRAHAVALAVETTEPVEVRIREVEQP